MSSSRVSDPDMIYKKQFHRRNDSGELDVFEAARYFSGYNEAPNCNINGATALSQKSLKEERSWKLGRGRISLDMPMRNMLPQHNSYPVEKQIMKEKKHKQPSSPGGRLASFLNSLFSQSSSKKKKSKSSSQSGKLDDDESPGGRRKRRSSISHFPTSMTAIDSKSFYSSSGSGFRTPPLYVHTPTKSYREFRSHSDHKQSMPLSKYNENLRSSTLTNVVYDEKSKKEASWVDEKLKFSNGLLDKTKTANGYPEKEKNWREKYKQEEREFRKLSEDDDGGDSDSSSDLFELQISDLDYYSTGLPVYETTNMDSIKRSGATISNA